MIISLSKTHVACSDNNDSTLIHSVDSPRKPLVTTYKLSFQDNLPSNITIWRCDVVSWRVHPAKVSGVKMFVEPCCGWKFIVSSAALLGLRDHCVHHILLLLHFVWYVCFVCVLMSPKIHSARNLHVHSFMRARVVGAGTPDILPEDQDSMLDTKQTRKQLCSLSAGNKEAAYWTVKRWAIRLPFGHNQILGCQAF